MSIHDDARLSLRTALKKGPVVIKVGSGVLTDKDGRLETKIVKRIAAEVAPLASPGRWPFIVSSGAIAIGMSGLGMKTRPRTIPGLQAAAAVGQSKLVEAWGNAFRKYEIPVGQVLLTSDDISNRTRFLNARAALLELQKRKAIAIINENDSVSYEEIAVGDNDGLAAQVSNIVNAGVLILLSVAPGILDKEGQIVSSRLSTDPELDGMLRASKSTFGKGGMATKLAAARAAGGLGAHVAIIDGKQPDGLTRLLAGENVGTVLLPPQTSDPLNSRSHWIAHALKPQGHLCVDQGASDALLKQNKSLLPSGIISVDGEFDAGESVKIMCGDEELGRGLVRYNSAQIRQIAGQKSEAIREKLGFSLGSEVIHKDDLVHASKL
ncbi:MAG: glutamate 5-kinase [Myxococcota bacterium]|nr:glutamate 5-kinase [Myxococcota bacterium]